MGAQKGVVVRTLEAMLANGAHVQDISVLLGPAVSGRNYEVPAEMAPKLRPRESELASPSDTAITFTSPLA